MPFCGRCGVGTKKRIEFCKRCAELLGVPQRAKKKVRPTPKKTVDPQVELSRLKLLKQKAEASRQRELKVFPRAGAVTVKKPDGSSEEIPAHRTPAELRAVAPERLPIPSDMKTKILQRDDHACRYCGNMEGPFEMDHVVPVAKGGRTSMGNLVTACRPCNGKKGAQVWKPRPLR